MTNHDIAAHFRELADLFTELKENVFKIRAYRRAARVIEAHPVPLAEWLARGERLQDLPGIGDAIAKKCEELLRTGRMETLEKARRRNAGETPSGEPPI